MTDNLLDELDRRIVDILSSDARVSNRKIATELDVTEGTIRGRIRRLEKEKLIRFTAVTNLHYAENLTLSFIGVQVDQQEVRQLAQAIADMDEINCVLILLGRFDVFAIGLFKNLEQLQDIANNKILSMKGVRHVETSLVVNTLKYNHKMAKIIQDPPSDDLNGNGK